MKRSKMYSVCRSDEEQYRDVIYTKEFSVICTDPFDKNFSVAVNSFPKVEFDSLIFSNRWLPQKINSQVVKLGLCWAKEGALLEFHRTERFVPHFHYHLYALETTPLSGFRKGWKTDDYSCEVEIGNLLYPMRHIALRAQP